MISFISLNSCQQDEITFENQFDPNHFVQECIAEFNTMQLESEVQGLTNCQKSDNPFWSLTKLPEWSRAYVREISLGHAAIIPLSYSESLFTKFGIKEYPVAIEQLSYLMMYRNSKGKMVIEVVIVSPSDEYVNSPENVNSPFKGAIKVYDWQFNYIKGYLFSDDGNIYNLAPPQIAYQAGKKDFSGTSKYEQKDCVITDWYSCPGYTTTLNSSCTYMFTEVDCSSTGTGGNSDGTGNTGNGGGDTGGSTNPGDYPTGGGGNYGDPPFNPNTTTDSKTPCKGDPLVVMKICPSQTSGILGGTYGWTRKDERSAPKFHDGFDLYAEPNTPVYSPWDNGIVVAPLVNNLPTNYYDKTSYGNYVWVEYTVNGQKIRMRFAHLNTVNVSVGDRVSHSTMLGLSGKTGNANKDYVEPHVHIQVKYYDSALGKWVESRQNGSYTLYPKCNPDLYLPSNFDYKTGVQTKSPCFSTKPEP
jgi:murein DD-endopeptidase MepM/ murein hydrolase activator NlpD